MDLNKYYESKIRTGLKDIHRYKTYLRSEELNKTERAFFRRGIEHVSRQIEEWKELN